MGALRFAVVCCSLPACSETTDGDGVGRTGGHDDPSATSDATEPASSTTLDRVPDAAAALTADATTAAPDVSDTLSPSASDAVTEAPVDSTQVPSGMDSMGEPLPDGGLDASVTVPESPYLPSDTNVPPEGDRRLLPGGALEGNLGNGWDFCRSGVAHESEGAADGEKFIRFDSKNDMSTDPDAPVAAFGFWLNETLPADEKLFLYFAARSAMQFDPASQLRVWGTGGLCTQEELLAAMPLSELALTSSWGTRCVELEPAAEYSVLGVDMTGTSYQVDVDTFRFGPPCHEP